jgi:hypothetical protein
MERLYYCAGSTLVTGDDIAQALVDYARWLVVRGEVDVVQVPTRTANGVGRISLLLSSTTQLSSETMTSETMTSGEDELLDPDLVAHLRTATNRLRLPHPAVAEESAASLADAFDY